MSRPMQTVHVDLGPRSYDIEIGDGNLPRVAQFVDVEHDDAHAVIITDANVDDLYAEPVASVLAEQGGVVGDLAGFVAATFARGLSFVQVPTTLLAQVDSSVGGKVGINLPGAKNMVGSFWQPRGVLVDVDVLQSLPEREFSAGLAEVVKYGVILDAEFFAWLEANFAAINAHDAAALRYIVERCCRLKADVV